MLKVSQPKPTTPGQILKEQFLRPMQLTQKQLSDHIGVDIMVINRIINGRARITPVVAVKLAYALNTESNFWFHAQTTLDIFKVEEKLHVRPACLFDLQQKSA